jgi:hypothetical protein
VYSLSRWVPAANTCTRARREPSENWTAAVGVVRLIRDILPLMSPRVQAARLAYLAGGGRLIMRADIQGRGRSEMTEQEWLASEDPAAMLRHLTHQRIPTYQGAYQSGWIEQELNEPLVSDRKLRLFAVACYWDVAVAADAVKCGGSAAAVEAELWADGRLPVLEPGTRNYSLESFPTGRDHAAGALRWVGYHRGNRTCEELAADQGHLLREIVGNPFQKPVWVLKKRSVGGGRYNWEKRDGSLASIGEAGTFKFFDADWLTPTVLSLARAAYDHRDAATGHLDPVTLAAVADALEEAGCPLDVTCQACKGKGGWSSTAGPRGGVGGQTMTACRTCDGEGVVPHPLLAHLRSPGPHVRGCWALDLILGKE